MKLFETWTYKGVKYIAVQVDGGVTIADEKGNFFGSWFSVKNFKKNKLKPVLGVTNLGQARITI